MTFRCAGVLLGLVGALAGGGCARDAAVRERLRAEVSERMKGLIASRLGAWDSALRELQNAAPVSAGRGWKAPEDSAALGSMRAAWKKGRVAYELVEGAVAPLFPESDLATDARYETFVTPLGTLGDRDPFDGRGVVGMHAIERVLWADSIPPEVIEFERAVVGYRPAVFPATEAEARAFKEGLVARALGDVRRLSADLAPLQLDVAFAFRGLVDLALEQKEKVDKAATGEEESRYAQTTLSDLRANMQGCREAYHIFQGWLSSTRSGRAVDARVGAAFTRLDVAYAAIPGDAIPRPPATWSSLAPKSADRVTPFGRLHAAVERETDPRSSDSLVTVLGEVADELELPRALFR